MRSMRFWFMMLACHVMLGISSLWIIQHVAKVYAHGWLASMDLSGASIALVIATFLGLFLVYVIQIRFAMAAVRLWRAWYQGRTSKSN